MSNEKMYKSVRNNQVAKLVSLDSEKAVMFITETKEEKVLKISTFKRWWRECEVDPETVVEPVVDKVVDVVPNKTSHLLLRKPGQYSADPEPEKEVAAEQGVKKEKPAKEPKTEKEKPDPLLNPIKLFVEQTAEELGTDVFVPNVANFRSIKVEGKMYMAYTFSREGVTLWMRSPAIKGLTEYKRTQHMFDARIKIPVLTQETKHLIRLLMNASLQYQIEKTTKVSK